MTGELCLNYNGRRRLGGYTLIFCMKILLCERSLKGHRKTYMEWLVRIPGIEFFILAPENIGLDETHFVKYDFLDGIKTIKSYFTWVNQIKNIVKNNEIDVVHILDGDSIMRWFGFGLRFSGAKKTLITYHHFFPGLVRKISYWLMCSGKRKGCIAHTASVENSLKHCGIKEVFRCEYPAFSFESIVAKHPKECKIKYGLPMDIPTIGIIGGMSKYKNIIPFLEMMQNCTQSFHILICGKERDITENTIKEIVKPYADKVSMLIRQLDDEEYEEAIVASDIIFCIYGYDFDGASGPLTDGVCAKKLILSCRHGSLGKLVSDNMLGITAECSDKKDMLKQTELALSRAKEFKYGVQANSYRESLNPNYFIERYRTIYYKSCKSKPL